MTATFRIDQPGITGGKPPVGDWGKARADLDLVGDGGTVEFTAQDAATSYLWQLISQVDGSAITLGTPTAQTATADIAVTGGYLLRLTTDHGLSTKDIQERYFGVPLLGSGLAIPALNETVQDNRDTVNPGYERKMTAWMKWIDATAQSSVNIFQAPPGTTLSSMRIGSGASVLADYAFSAGAENIIDATSHYAFAYGGTQWPQYPEDRNQITDNSEYAVAFGRANIVSGYALFSFVQGELNEVYGDYHQVMGYRNWVGTSIFSRSSCFVVGAFHDIDGDQVTALGRGHWSGNNGREAILLGNGAYAWWPGSLYHAMNPPRVPGVGQVVLCTHLSEETTDDSWTDLLINPTGPIYYLELRPQTIYVCELCLIGRTSDATGDPSKLKTWIVRFTVHNDFDDNVVLFPVDKTVLATTSLIDEASWDVDVTMMMATSPPQMIIRIKGAAAVDTRWYGVLQTVSYEDQ